VTVADKQQPKPVPPKPVTPPVANPQIDRREGGRSGETREKR